MTDFLEQVIAERRAYVKEARARRPLDIAPIAGEYLAGVGDLFTSALLRRKRAGEMGVIAEVKRASPALGRLAAPTLDPVEQARRYVRAGATAISVLTEPRHWGGSLDDLARIHASLPHAPLLCKDVIVDEYQIAEAKQAGAAAVLLIAEALSDEELRAFGIRAATLTLGVLAEAHERAAFERVAALGFGVVGVNARDLREPSRIDAARVHELHGIAQPRQILVAESGISSVDDARMLPPRVDAVLIGTALMRADDPAPLIRGIVAIRRTVPA
jgi:indole-3-glycerol phosphate synthase